MEIIWLASCAVIGLYAYSLHRSFFAYFVWSMLFTPILVGVALFLMGINTDNCTPRF